MILYTFIRVSNCIANKDYLGIALLVKANYDESV